MTPVEKVLSRFPDARKSSKGWTACCPAHEDQNPSLSIDEGDDGRALIHCHAGCSTDAVCRAKGLALADLMPDRGNGSPAPRCDRRPVKAFPSAAAAIRDLERGLGPRSQEWPYYDDHGVHVGSVIRWNKPHGKEIRPIRRQDGQWRIGGMQALRPLYRLPELKAVDLVVVAEGEKAADAAVALGFSATTSAHGSQSANQTDWSPLAGKRVIILPDNDSAGDRYAKDVTAILTRLEPTPTIKVVSLPHLPAGGDIADLVEAVGIAGHSDLRNRINALIEEASPEHLDPADAARTEDDRPTIWIEKGEKPRITDQSLAVLAQDHFERGGQLVRCLPASRGVLITPTTAEAVDDALNRRARFASRIQDERAGGEWTERPESAPAWLAKTIVGMQRWQSIRPLEGIHSGPFLREDGSIGGMRAGYDPRSRCWIDTHDDWTPLDTPPTTLLVDEAIATLREIIEEFPFANDAAESVWVSLILTRLARSAFRGPSPLFVIDATTPGSGKTMLARLAGLIADGRAPGMMSLSESEEEIRKAITSSLQEGAAYLVFDNVSGDVKSPTLDRLLTSTEWRDRILGKSQMLWLPNHAIPVITSNNADIRADTSRRSLVLRLAPLQEKPEERTFRIANLDEHVLANRRRLLIAAMRILQWHVVSGRPQQEVRPLGSFEGWSSLVRQAVIHAGLPDPVITTGPNAEVSAVDTFLRCWRDWNQTWQGSARHLIEAAFGDHSTSSKALQEAMLELVGQAKTKDGRPEPQALGNHLGRIQGRNFAGLKVVRTPKREASGYVWQLVQAAPAADQ
jgi:hypothetical protein